MLVKIAKKIVDLMIPGLTGNDLALAIISTMPKGTEADHAAIRNEYVQHAWDVEDLADKILSVITHPALFTCLSEFGSQEAKAISWLKSASRCLQVYQLVLNEAK